VQQRELETSRDAPPLQLSFPDRLAEAMLELRANRGKYGAMASLAGKYSVGYRTLFRYRGLMQHELEREPPITDEVFRMMMRKMAQSREKHRRGHNRYFTV